LFSRAGKRVPHRGDKKVIRCNYLKKKKNRQSSRPDNRKDTPNLEHTKKRLKSSQDSKKPKNPS